MCSALRALSMRVQARAHVVGRRARSFGSLRRMSSRKGRIGNRVLGAGALLVASAFACAPGTGGPAISGSAAGPHTAEQSSEGRPNPAPVEDRGRRPHPPSREHRHRSRRFDRSRRTHRRTNRRRRVHARRPRREARPIGCLPPGRRGPYASRNPRRPPAPSRALSPPEGDCVATATRGRASPSDCLRGVARVAPSRVRFPSRSPPALERRLA